jgi:hypothetical protein
MDASSCSPVCFEMQRFMLWSPFPMTICAFLVAPMASCAIWDALLPITASKLSHALPPAALAL